MTLNTKSRNYLRYSGYSAIELIFVLFIIIGLILMTNSILSVMAKNRRNNQIADQVKVYQKAAVMYITDNYRDIVLNIKQTGNNFVIPAGGNSGYLHTGVMPVLSNGQVPCLYITKNDIKTLDASIKAYLIFGNSNSKLKPLSFKDAMEVANAIGGTAGVMVPTENGFKVQGLNFNSNLRFDYNLNIGSQCAFNGGHGASGIPDNSIIIDLTADNNFFQQLVNVINPNDDIPPPKNPSLQKSGDTDATGMRTNLYLDNIISEQSTQKHTYCSAFEITDDPTSTCNAYAAMNGYELVSGSCSWNSSIMQNGACLSTVKGRYIQRVMGCANTDFGDATQYCPSNINNSMFVNGTARWDGKRQVGNYCQANAIAQYQSENCDFQCAGSRSIFQNSMDCGSEIDAICSVGGWPNLIVDSGGDRIIHGVMQNNGCYVTVKCQVFSRIFYRTKSGIVSPNISGPSSTIDCGTAVAPLSTDNILPVGEIVGGSKITRLLENTVVIPAQHRYRGVNLGDSSRVGQKVQIKSDAPDGSDVSTSVLNINHAGIQSGTIGLASHIVLFGDTCKTVDLGKIVQQNSLTKNDIQAQLRCTYSPVSCPSPGYCYLPVKSASREIHFNIARQIASCPDELIVDANQPSELLDSNVKCPDLSQQNYTLTQNIHDELYGCYASNMSGVNFCGGIKAVCAYRDLSGNNLSYPMKALLGIQCIAKNNTFVINDYKQ